MYKSLKFSELRKIPEICEVSKRQDKAFSKRLFHI